jgi:hypothetical protein
MEQPEGGTSMTPQCDCGGLKPAQGEKPVAPNRTAEEVMSEVRLICDDNTGAFFFRYNGKLYLRVVECSEE